MNDLLATFGDYVRVFAGVPNKELSPYRYLRHTSQLSHRPGGVAAKVLWTMQVSKVTFSTTLG
jgi:hypothetical protein